MGFTYGPLGLVNGGVTPEGGHFVWMTNGIGSATEKGQLVAVSDTDDNEFVLLPADAADCIGVVYDDGVADGGLCRIVIQGVADVLLEDGTGATRGYWARGSETVAGRADITEPNPPGFALPHFSEIGHGMQTVSSGTDVLARCFIHFN